jgi:hypothetical protein
MPIFHDGNGLIKNTKTVDARVCAPVTGEPLAGVPFEGHHAARGALFGHGCCIAIATRAKGTPGPYAPHTGCKGQRSAVSALWVLIIFKRPPDHNMVTV